jgi:hypothetical protein
MKTTMIKGTIIMEGCDSIKETISSSINKKEKQEKGGSKLERESVFIKYKC